MRLSAKLRAWLSDTFKTSLFANSYENQVLHRFLVASSVLGARRICFVIQNIECHSMRLPRSYQASVDQQRILRTPKVNCAAQRTVYASEQGGRGSMPSAQSWCWIRHNLLSAQVRGMCTSACVAFHLCVVHREAWLSSQRPQSHGLQGTVFSKYVELDFDEVACKKVMAIDSKEVLRTVAEEGNPCEVDKKNGTLTSPEYCVLPADLRDLEQV